MLRSRMYALSQNRDNITVENVRSHTSVTKSLYTIAPEYERVPTVVTGIVTIYRMPFNGNETSPAGEPSPVQQTSFNILICREATHTCDKQ